MTWSQMTLELRTSSCPYADRLRPGQRIQCHQPGDRHGVAHMDGDVEGWDRLDPHGLARPRTPCDGCPAKALPHDVAVECAQVLPGRVRIHGVCRDRATVLEAYRGAAAGGQGPHLCQVRDLRDGRRNRWVDLSGLSNRQWEALREAAALGYFHSGGGRRQGVDELAQRLGCGRSAAHEHLRKGLDRLLAAIAGDLRENHG